MRMTHKRNSTFPSVGWSQALAVFSTRESSRE